MPDYNLDLIGSFGYPCVSCGRDCSGLGRCDNCWGPVCFLCAEERNYPVGTAILCQACSKQTLALPGFNWPNRENHQKVQGSFSAIEGFKRYSILSFSR